MSGNLTWNSNLDGDFRTGATPLPFGGLRVGVHTITARVTDNGGLLASASITLNVVNTAPVVTINAPADGSEVNWQSNVFFTGSAIDTEEGDISGNLHWTSNRDGLFKTGNNVTYSGLSLGGAHHHCDLFGLPKRGGLGDDHVDSCEYTAGSEHHRAGGWSRSTVIPL